jgi:hypothetical protein
MRKRTPIAISGLAVCSSLVVLATGRASDHLDGPRTIADPQADITDIFAFTSPESPGRVVLAMTVAPFASRAGDGSAASGEAATFSAMVDYVFRVRRVTASQPLTMDATPLDIACTFDDGDGATQTVTCRGPGGMQATAISGAATNAMPQSGMRVFAGLRSDPAFFDRQGALATMATGRASFTGQNAFSGADVLAIVVEMEARAFSDAGSALPILAVAGETVRRGR